MLVNRGGKIDLLRFRGITDYAYRTPASTGVAPRPQKNVLRMGLACTTSALTHMPISHETFQGLYRADNELTSTFHTHTKVHTANPLITETQRALEASTQEKGEALVGSFPHLSYNPEAPHSPYPFQNWLPFTPNLTGSWWLAPYHWHPSCQCTPHNKPKPMQAHQTDICCLQSAWSDPQKRRSPIFLIDLGTVTFPPLTLILDQPPRDELITGRWPDLSKTFDWVTPSVPSSLIQRIRQAPIVVSCVECFLNGGTLCKPRLFGGCP